MQKKDKCRLCRRAGEKLFLKGEKCNLPSCPVARRAYGPGQHRNQGKRFRRMSDYSLQLNEKQKARAIYGISELQLLTYYKKARKVKGASGQKLMDLLESRIDNVIYRAGWASTRSEARQISVHGRVKINNKKTRSANILMKRGDKLEIVSIKESEKSDIPEWIKVTGKSLEVISSPVFDKGQSIINEQLIIEYYSR